MTAKKTGQGAVHIVNEWCKGCSICVVFCQSGTLKMSEHFNARGYYVPQVVDPDRCTGCGMCRRYCPEFAIYHARKKVKNDREG
jgi:2-oxoglutarate ferredoxin oxidoreductase subunit delta